MPRSMLQGLEEWELPKHWESMDRWQVIRRVKVDHMSLNTVALLLGHMYRIIIYCYGGRAL